ncbi:MAG: transposase [Algoriphagus sp.]|uniref:REP-associated tyrosine transposase n=1 Tax=Algoriphagus sp. TaxID=1872435 RepID=UPI0026379B58|nr:transposase [Algoriphagus sp.]MDG1279023.1 transposase [Algoriphagus sp.]
MGFEFKIRDQGAVHFLIFTVHQWTDVFTRKDYSDLLLESLIYCQKNKGLEIYSWVIMSNHIHLIASAKNENLSDLIRDFKKFTSKQIFKAIQDNPKESRKSWLILALSHQNQIWFWEDGYHGEEIFSLKFFRSKVNYIHQNPVRAGIVEKEEEYLNSSAGDFYGIRKGPIQLAEFG